MFSVHQRIVAWIALLAIAVSAHAQQQRQRQFVPGQLIVGPRPGARAVMKQSMRDAGFDIVKEDLHGEIICIRVPVGEEALWLEQLADAPGVGYVELDIIGRGGVVPNDTHFAQQWHHRNAGQFGGAVGADIDSDLAWDITTGSSDVVVAVLDTGIDSDHPEFAGRIDPDGRDFINGDLDPEDDHGHGTGVAGCITANADNGFGVAAVSWHSMVLPVKVLNASNLGSTSALVLGINYAAAQADVDIISMSLIDYPNATSLNTALQNARDAGKILIACAGNGGVGNADFSWPGASPLTISIGATDNTDARALFSGTGSALDFVAPGESIVTLTYDTAWDTFSFESGCSFATPITAGVAALLVARAAELGVSIDHDDVYDLLRDGAEDQVGPGEDTPGRDDFFGHGRINARACLDALAMLADCNMNGVLDAIDIAEDPLLDVDENGVIDDCDTRVNDDCVASINLSEGDRIITTRGATPSGPAESCGDFESDVWFRLPMGGTEDVTISICDASWDAQLALYTFICPTATGTPLACAGDGCGGGQPSITMTLGLGLYRVRVSGANGERGTATLSVSFADPEPPPCPWDCAPPPNGNGVVNVDDLLAVVNAITTQEPGCDVAPDNGDGSFGNGVVNFDDLVDVINHFGACPAGS